MNRTFKTGLLALIIVGGLWVLFNQQQINHAGGIIAFASKQLSGFNRSTNTFRTWPNSSHQFANDRSGNPQWSAAHRFGNSDRTNFFPAAAYPLSNPRRENPFEFSGHGRFTNNTLPGLRAPTSGKIRIASFKMNAKGKNRSGKRTIDLLSDLCLRFDIVAFQEIDERSIGWLEEVGQNVAKLSGGAVLLRAISDRTKVGPGQPVFVIVYNSATLDLDFAHWYSVNDPDDLMIRPPLVGWFRTRGVAEDEAFTFTLANIQLDDHRPDLELAYLGELFRAIRQDGRGEDDVIITGNFHAGDRGLTAVRQRAGLTWVVYDTVTSTDKESQFDNLVFAQNATVEFTGQGGVFDFLSAYNLTLDQANAISDHMPIWAEFSIYEGTHEARAQSTLNNPVLPNRSSNQFRQPPVTNDPSF